MRLVATEYISLDGVFEEPGHWSSPFFDDEAAAFKFGELQAADAQLLGRKTYDGFAAAWPTMEGTGEFGEKMNSMPKYVVSSTLENPSWSGSQVIKGDVVEEEVRRLKAERGKDLLLAGSGRLFRTLMDANLIDVYRFMVHPIVLGGGKKLFAEPTSRTQLKLTSARPLPKGIVIVEYQPVADDKAGGA